jgi:hypothetical protein
MNKKYLSDFERFINTYDNFIKRLLNKGDENRARKIQKIRDKYLIDYEEMKTS